MAGGAGSTDWEAYGLEQLWQMVRDEDKAATISMDQHAAFGLMHDVLEHEVDVLTRAVKQLEAKWPPRPGTAADSTGDSTGPHLQAAPSGHGRGGVCVVGT